MISSVRHTGLLLLGFLILVGVACGDTAEPEADIVATAAVKGKLESSLPSVNIVSQSQPITTPIQPTSTSIPTTSTQQSSCGSWVWIPSDSTFIKINIRGSQYYKNGQYHKAIEDFTCIILNWDKFWAIKDPPNLFLASSYLLRGYSYTKLGENDKAVSDYREVINLIPSGATGYEFRADAYIKLGEPEKAIEDYTVSIDNDKALIGFGSVSAFTNRSWAFIVLQQYEKAINDATEAISINPEFADSYYNRAIAYDNLGQKDKAAADQKKACELDRKHCR